MLVYEIFEVAEDNIEKAIEKIRSEFKRDSVIVGGDNVRQLAHPSHLQEVLDKFPPPELPVEVQEENAAISPVSDSAPLANKD